MMEAPQLCTSAKIPMDSGGYTEVNTPDVSEVTISNGKRGTYMTVFLKNRERVRVKMDSIDEAVYWMKEIESE